MSQVKINLNNCARVRLTPRGIEELRRQHVALRASFPSVGEFIAPVTDDDGYATFQLWELMATFGHLIFMGSSRLPFETDLFVETGRP